MSNENISSNNVKGTNKLVDLTRKNRQENRKTLQTLQYSTGAPISPIRKIVKPQKKNLIEKGQKPITVFVDPPRKKLDDKASQTEKTNRNGVDADDLMSDEVSESYWKELAEERRKALNESLHENEQLHKEVSELKEENEKLSKVAGQAEYFANVLKDVLGADDDEEEDKEVINSTDSDASEQNSNNEIIESNNLLVDNCVEKTESIHSDEILQESESDGKHTIMKDEKHKTESVQVESTSEEVSSDQIP